ncbi:MAG: hypothetical protein ACRDLB_12895 [Actinomycetota bacterium]
MRKRTVRMSVVALVLSALGGPLAVPADAAEVSGCKLAEKLGVVWIRECEDTGP